MLSLILVVSQVVRPALLVGDWQGWWIVGGYVQGLKPSGMKADLRLRKDGRFEYRMSSRVMTNVDAAMDGKYQVKGRTLTLRGLSKARLDDGYRKWMVNGPKTMVFEITKEGLLQKDGRPDGMAFYFRRKGEGPPKKRR